MRKNKNKISAIGECGLDYSQNEDPKKQKDLFLKQISLAEKIKKPIIVHSRKAEADCVDILESSRIKKIIMHPSTNITKNRKYQTTRTNSSKTPTNRFKFH